MAKRADLELEAYPGELAGLRALRAAVDRVHRYMKGVDIYEHGLLTSDRNPTSISERTSAQTIEERLAAIDRAEGRRR